MLDATRCSLAGLCFCLLAISAAALPSSTIFCCTFLPLLLVGCPLFARFLFPSQAKPVAVKRHRKRGRLKTDTVANGSMGDSVQEAQATDITRDTFVFHAELWDTGCCGTSFIAVAVALSVAGIVVTALAPTALEVIQAGGDRFVSGDGDLLGRGDGSRIRWGAGARLGSGSGIRLGSDGGNQLGCSVMDRLGHGSGDRPGCDDGDGLGSSHDSGGGGQLGGSCSDRLGWGGGDRLRFDGGTIECGCSGRLGCANRDRLGLDGGDGLGRDGGEGLSSLSYSNDEGLRVGSHSRFSEGRLEYGVNSCESENDGWTVGYKVAARKGSGSALLARMLFDKDNPENQQ